MDLAKFNEAWLQAWSDKDVDRLLQFYAHEVVYTDQQNAMGLRGQEALRGYLQGLFAATPPMRYAPDVTWPIDGGYCGRWTCTIQNADGTESYLRGFDLVLIEHGRIAVNEVYTHRLERRPGN